MFFSLSPNVRFLLYKIAAKSIATTGSTYTNYDGRTAKDLYHRGQSRGKTLIDVLPNLSGGEGGSYMICTLVELVYVQYVTFVLKEPS